MTAVLLLGGCALEPRCPSAPDALDAAALADLDEDLVVATAIVNRFVPAADPDFRGYDIEIRDRLAGLDESEQLMFVKAATPTMDPGVGVFVYGEHGPRPAEISSSGGCRVLTPLDE